MEYNRCLRRLRLIVLFLSVFLLTPVVFALNTGFSPIDKSIGMIGRIFNAPSLQSPIVAEGFARFAFFIMIFTILNWAARKVFIKNTGADNADYEVGRRAGIIVSLVLALLSAFIVPRNVIMTAATGYSALIWSLVAVGPVLAAWYYAFIKKS